MWFPHWQQKVKLLNFYNLNISAKVNLSGNLFQNDIKGPRRIQFIFLMPKILATGNNGQKKFKKWFVSVFGWSSQNKYSKIAITNNFVTWKHVVRPVLLGAQLWNKQKQRKSYTVPVDPEAPRGPHSLRLIHLSCLLTSQPPRCLIFQDP